MTRAELENKMAVMMGGRAAERVVFDEISTGASDDIMRATDLARAMVLRYGMTEAIGNVAYDRERSQFLQPGIPMPQSRDYSEDTANTVDNTVRALVDGALERAIKILENNRALLDRTAEELLQAETLNEPEIENLKRQITARPVLPRTETNPPESDKVLEKM
jgi:cell division protease FtsH